MSKVAGPTRDCGVVYHADVDPKLGAYESTLQRGVHSMLQSLDHSLEYLRRDNGPAGLQWDSVFLFCAL